MASQPCLMQLLMRCGVKLVRGSTNASQTMVYYALAQAKCASSSVLHWMSNSFACFAAIEDAVAAARLSLDLQIFDTESQSYHSLSEGDSLTRTQKRINQLLNLDYETFSNSAFIVQGRADAFTEKNARQRKAILSQILGLERYDQLQSLRARAFKISTSATASACDALQNWTES